MLHCVYSKQTEGSETNLFDFQSQIRVILHLRRAADITTPGENSSKINRLWTAMMCQH